MRSSLPTVRALSLSLLLALLAPGHGMAQQWDPSQDPRASGYTPNAGMGAARSGAAAEAAGYRSNSEYITYTGPTMSQLTWSDVKYSDPQWSSWDTSTRRVRRSELSRQPHPEPQYRVTSRVSFGSIDQYQQEQAQQDPTERDSQQADRPPPVRETSTPPEHWDRYEDYRSQESWPPPGGTTFGTLPSDVQTLDVDGSGYFYLDGAFLAPASMGGKTVYQAVRAPVGAIVKTKPPGCGKMGMGSRTFFVCGEDWYLQWDNVYVVTNGPA